MSLSVATRVAKPVTPRLPSNSSYTERGDSYAFRTFAIISSGAVLSAALLPAARVPAQQQPRAVIDPVRIMEARYEVAGPEGRLLVERAFRPDNDAGVLRLIRGATEHVEEVPAANQFAAEADHFARSVRAGHLLPPAEDGVAQARVLEALYASAGT